MIYGKPCNNKKAHKYLQWHYRLPPLCPLVTPKQSWPYPHSALPLGRFFLSFFNVFKYICSLLFPYLLTYLIFEKNLKYLFIQILSENCTWKNIVLQKWSKMTLLALESEIWALNIDPDVGCPGFFACQIPIVMGEN